MRFLKTVFILGALFLPAVVFVPVGIKLASVGVIIGGIYAGIPCMFGMAWIIEIAIPKILKRSRNTQQSHGASGVAK